MRGARPRRGRAVGARRIGSRITSCLVPDCTEPALGALPVALCAEHATAVAESFPFEEPLPGPCRLCGSRQGVRGATRRICAVCEWPWGEQPDREVPPPRVDVVYYLAFRTRVKIGTTANPRQRFAALPHERVLAFERGDRRLERRRHDQFAAERGGSSEWFERSERLDAHVAVLAGGVDPWDRWRRWVAEATAAQ